MHSLYHQTAEKGREKKETPGSCLPGVPYGMGEINYLWIRPEPSPPASFSTSGTVTML